MNLKTFLLSFPPSLTRGDWIMFAFFGLLFLKSAAFRLLAVPSKNAVVSKLGRKNAGGSLSFAIIGAIWAGMRYLEIPYLGTRLAGMIVLVSFAIWAAFVLKYLVMNYSLEKRQWEQNQIKLRYLNGSK